LRKDSDRARRPAWRGKHRHARSQEGLAPNLYYRWSKEFLEARKKRLVGDTSREATSTEVIALRQENARLKQVVAETVLENRLLKKSLTAVDSDDEVSA
jgi:transposase